MAVPDLPPDTSPSPAFTAHWKHIKDCHMGKGTFTAAVQEFRAQIAATVPEKIELTDYIGQQRSNELAFLDGYLEGPGCGYIDAQHDSDRLRNVETGKKLYPRTKNYREGKR